PDDPETASTGQTRRLSRDKPRSEKSRAALSALLRCIAAQTNTTILAVPSSDTCTRNIERQPTEPDMVFRASPLSRTTIPMAAVRRSPLRPRQSIPPESGSLGGTRTRTPLPQKAFL